MGAMVAISLIGTAVSAVGAIATGQAEQRAADYQAEEDEVSAKEERAAGQHDAMDYQHQLTLAQSAAQARAADSGFGASDPTVESLSGELAEYGTMQSQMAQYGGDSRAAGLQDEAYASRLSGQADATGSYFKAAGTILYGFKGIYDDYGPNPFQPMTSD
jgi:hypothetical protein